MGNVEFTIDQVQETEVLDRQMKVIMAIKITGMNY